MEYIVSSYNKLQHGLQHVYNKNADKAHKYVEKFYIDLKYR